MVCNYNWYLKGKNICWPKCWQIACANMCKSYWIDFCIFVCVLCIVSVADTCFHLYAIRILIEHIHLFTYTYKTKLCSQSKQKTRYQAWQQTDQLMHLINYRNVIVWSELRWELQMWVHCLCVVYSDLCCVGDLILWLFWRFEVNIGDN